MTNELQNQRVSKVSETGATKGRITAEAFERLWFKLVSAYPKQEVTAATLATYYDRLRFQRPDSLAHAIDVCIDRFKWFPGISEILEVCGMHVPTTTRKALNEPRPTPEQLKRNLGILRGYRDTLAAKFNVRDEGDNES